MKPRFEIDREIARREQQAAALAKALRAAGSTVEQARKLSAQGRLLTAAIAGVEEPTDLVWDRTVQMMREAVAAVKRIQDKRLSC